MPQTRKIAGSRPRAAPARRRLAELEQENSRLRQMYLRLSLEHSALQEVVIAVAMRKDPEPDNQAGPASAPAESPKPRNR